MHRFYFDGIELDRSAHRRRDPEWIEAQWRHERVRVLPVWRERSLVHVEGSASASTDASTGASSAGVQPALLVGRDAIRFDRVAAVRVFLGLHGGVPYFAADVSDLDEPVSAGGLEFPAGATFEDLRSLATAMDGASAGALAYARAVCHWHRTHRFCGACGAPTESRDGGHERACTDSSCGRRHFPRTDPAVIMLVIHPDGRRCLLGRNRRFRGLTYSTLAGFVEPGERLEDAVVREVFEETSVRVTDVEYLASQPWPFPASLMLGFRARATTTEVCCDEDDDVVEARWFTRDEVRELARTPGTLPSEGLSISRWLIDGFVGERPGE